MQRGHAYLENCFRQLRVKAAGTAVRYVHVLRMDSCAEHARSHARPCMRPVDMHGAAGHAAMQVGPVAIQVVVMAKPTHTLHTTRRSSAMQVGKAPLWRQIGSGGLERCSVDFAIATHKLELHEGQVHAH